MDSQDIKTDKYINDNANLINLINKCPADHKLK